MNNIIQSLELNLIKNKQLILSILFISACMSSDVYAAAPMEIDFSGAAAPMLPPPPPGPPMGLNIRYQNYRLINNSLFDDYHDAENNGNVQIKRQKWDYITRLAELKRLMDRGAGKGAILAFASADPMNAELVFGVYGNDEETFTAQELDIIQAFAGIA